MARRKASALGSDGSSTAAAAAATALSGAAAAFGAAGRAACVIRRSRRGVCSTPSVAMALGFGRRRGPAAVVTLRLRPADGLVFGLVVGLVLDRAGAS